MPGELGIREEHHEGIINIYLSGEVDIYTSQDLKDKLYSIVDSNKADIRIDCTELNYIDSTGLGVLVGALKRAKQFGGRVFIRNLKDSIKKLFIITSLDKVFLIEE